MNTFVSKNIFLGFRVFVFGKFFRGPGLLSEWGFSALTERVNDGLREEVFSVRDLSWVGAVLNIFSGWQKIYESHNRIAILKFPAVSEWSDKRISECPAVPGFISSDNEVFSQRCFCMRIGGINVWLPKIELAGRLFFQNEMLSIAAFEPSWLDFNFYVFEGDGEVLDVYCLSEGGVDFSVIEDKACRDHLGWLLIDRDFKRSFESIWRCLNLERKISPDGFSEWDFNFVPPECLEGVVFSAMGDISEDGKDFLVWEIVKIEIPVSGGKKIIFHYNGSGDSRDCDYRPLIHSHFANPPADSIYFDGDILTIIAPEGDI